MIKPLILFTSLVLACLSGCAIHTIDIQQGNVITKDMVDQLKPGMKKNQVRVIMGTPLIQDVFHANRWDYIYTLQPGTEDKITKRDHVTLYFDKEELVKIAPQLDTATK